VQAAILNGDALSGVTIMKMDAGVDTGDMLSQRELPILPDDTAGSLSAKLAALGADLLLETLPAYLRGAITPMPQDSSQANRAPMLSKEDGRLDFSQPAGQLALKVRAFNPWPGAFTDVDGQGLKVHRAHAELGSGQPGDRLALNGLPALATADGLLVLDEVQPAGRRPMPGEVFLRGARGWLRHSPGSP
jgi:methionyl-tRNA formyltransferase